MWNGSGSGQEPGRSNSLLLYCGKGMWHRDRRGEQGTQSLVPQGTQSLVPQGTHPFCTSAAFPSSRPEHVPKAPVPVLTAFRRFPGCQSPGRGERGCTPCRARGACWPQPLCVGTDTMGAAPSYPDCKHGPWWFSSQMVCP